MLKVGWRFFGARPDVALMREVVVLLEAVSSVWRCRVASRV